MSELSVKNLSKSYDSGKIKIIENLTITLPSSTLIGITGPSGSGKSTLLNLLGTLDRPDSGSIVLRGIDLTQLNESKLAFIRSKHLGFIFQHHYLLADFDAQENIALPHMILGHSKEKSMEKALRLLTKVGLKDRASHRLGSLSGGERQRVAIARSFINEPDFLFADEPTGNLDDNNAEHILDNLRALIENKHTTVVMVTHNEKLALRCETRWHLENKRLESL